MNARFAALPLIAYLLAVIALPGSAQEPVGPLPDETAHLYLGNGLTLSATKPRLLTANAGVTQFEYSPSGARIAYITLTSRQNVTYTTLAIADTHRDPQDNPSTVYYKASSSQMVTNAAGDIAQAPTGESVVNLWGWSDDAAYLAFAVTRQTARGDTANDANVSQFHYINTVQIEYVDLVRATVSSVPFPPEALTPPPADQTTPAGAETTADAQPPMLTDVIMSNAAWAPGAELLAYKVYATFTGDKLTTSLCLFDPTRPRARLLLQGDRLTFQGWLDSHRILYRVGKEYFIYDLSAGKSEPAPANHEKPDRSLYAGNTIGNVPAGKGLTLSVSRSQAPVTSGAQSYGNAASIWIKRQGGPVGPNQLLVDTFGDPSLSWNPPTTDAQFAPDAGFDRQGMYQVAYLAQGDLKVCDLTTRPATLVEQALGGEKLPCDQLRLLAMINAKRLGLAILMYCQDYDEHFPTSDGFDDSIAPYMEPDNPIDLPGLTFQYIQPASLALADAQSPADTPIGRYQLPCASVTITVYMDGHVKAQDNP